MEKILVIQSAGENCQNIRDAIGQLGLHSSCAHTLGEGLLKIAAEPFAVVFLEAQLPDGSGVDGIARIKTHDSSPEIVVLPRPAAPTRRSRQSAMAPGTMFPGRHRRSSSISTSSRSWNTGPRRGSENRHFRSTGKEIIGSSSSLAASFDLLAQAAQSDVNVILSGETGTGKELFARAIHDNSRRAQGNFVVVDCTALPDTLVESVLFGHMKGAFTGAHLNQDGLVKQADKGTLFLDEIGELPLAIQKSFLRVIQEHKFRPVGGGREIASDFRLVVATNRDLGQMVRQGHFREDLLFRLRSLVIELPPLRQRRDDIKELVLHYMGTLCQRFRLAPKEFSPDFWNAVQHYPWPGNIRELIQALEKTLLTAGEESIIYPKHLPTYVRIQVARDQVQPKAKVPEAPALQRPAPTAPPLLKEFHREAVSTAEKQYFRNLMEFTAGDIAEACRLSGLSRSRLYALLKKYQLPTELDGK